MLHKIEGKEGFTVAGLIKYVLRRCKQSSGVVEASNQLGRCATGTISLWSCLSQWTIAAAEECVLPAAGGSEQLQYIWRYGSIYSPCVRVMNSYTEYFQASWVRQTCTSLESHFYSEESKDQEEKKRGDWEAEEGGVASGISGGLVVYRWRRAASVWGEEGEEEEEELAVKRAQFNRYSFKAIYFLHQYLDHWLNCWFNFSMSRWRAMRQRRKRDKTPEGRDGGVSREGNGEGSWRRPSVHTSSINPSPIKCENSNCIPHYIFIWMDICCWLTSIAPLYYSGVGGGRHTDVVKV